MDSKSAPIIGYRYALGLHLALCHGPVDMIREILVDRRTAWSARLGGGTGGEGAGVEPRIGQVAAMSAVAALPGEIMARVTFAGTLDGMRLGTDYRLRLADGRTLAITLRAVAYDATTAQTTWSVLPAGLSLPAQPVEILEARAPVANSGARGGRIHIDAPQLFNEAEGGIVGDVDVLMGAPDQGANDYLASVMSGPVPAYRGLCSLVLRQVGMGNNPYLKPWAVRLTRVMRSADGAEQWYPETAAIPGAAQITDAAILIALDVSGSMSGNRMAAQIAAVAAFIRTVAAGADPAAPNDIRITLWNDAVVGAIERRAMGPEDYADLEAWMLVLSNATSGGTNFAAAFDGARAFFEGSGASQRVVLFVTDGEPSPLNTVDAAEILIAALPPVSIFGFNIALSNTTFTARIDNTPDDGVPVVPSNDPGPLVAAFLNAFRPGPDMNPAHIIRECLTNPDWGLGYSALEVGESFAAAALTLHGEGFGLSLIWQEDSAIEEFIASILDHIDATLFIDRSTGLWELKLIRADYVASSLPLFDESHVVDWGSLGRRAPSELINSLTLRCSDARTDETGAVTVTDTARVQAMGGVIAATLDYPGIRNQSLALRVAERDLRALSNPLLSGEIVVTRIASGLGPGDVIRLRSPRLGLDDVVMRLSEIGQGDGRDNGIRLVLAEDVFALGATAIAGGPLFPPPPLTTAPRPLTQRLVTEAPWWLIVRELGHAEAERRLTEDPATGALLAVATRPDADALGAEIWVDSGAGPQRVGRAGFAPGAVLAEDLADYPEARAVAVTGWREIAALGIGTLASIGGELVRVDGISEGALTLGRGCLDTVPRAHAAGTPVIFWGAVASLPEASWLAGEAVSVRLLPQTGRGTLAFARAPEDALTFDRRALRPLPPGRVQGNGSYTPDPDALINGNLVLTWAHRDRLTQTSPVIADHTMGDIGPEPGVSYAAEIAWIDPDTGQALAPAALVLSAGTGTSFTLTPADIDESTAPPRMAEIEVAIRAQREVEGLPLTDREASPFRLTAPGTVGWGRGWGVFWGN